MELLELHAHGLVGLPVAGSNPDGSGDQNLVFTKKLDATAGSDFEGLTIEITFSGDMVRTSSELFGKNLPGKALSLSDLNACPPDTVREVLLAVERDVWARPDNVARMQASVAEMKAAIDGAFDEDAKKYELNYGKESIPVESALAGLGFR